MDETMTWMEGFHYFMDGSAGGWLLPAMLLIGAFAVVLCVPGARVIGFISLAVAAVGLFFLFSSFGQLKVWADDMTEKRLAACEASGGIWFAGGGGGPISRPVPAQCLRVPDNKSSD